MTSNNKYYSLSDYNNLKNKKIEREEKTQLQFINNVNKHHIFEEIACDKVCKHLNLQFIEYNNDKFYDIKCIDQ